MRTLSEAKLRNLLSVLALAFPGAAMAVGTWGGGDPPSNDVPISADGLLLFLLLAGAVWAIAASGKGDTVAAWFVGIGSVGGLAALAFMVGGGFGLAAFCALLAWWWFKS